MLRPRDLVPVRFDLAPAPKGFYVPGTAITLIGDAYHVFRVEDGVARATPVSLHESVEGRRRIEGESIAQGIRVIVGGVHYVSDGQPVSVTGVLP